METAARPLSGPTLPSTNPRDGTVQAQVPAHEARHVAEMMARARAAQPAWAARPVGERARLLLEVRRRFLARGEDFARLLAEENGKPEGEAWTAEIVACGDIFTHWAAHAAEYLEPDPVPLNPVTYPAKKGFIEYVPRGVVGIIAPWNYPVAIPLRNIVPALVAGNAVILKPSGQCPRLAQALADLFQGALPEGLFHVIVGRGSLGTALVEAKPDFVSFTGSVPVGRELAALCGKLLVPCAMELGGKDAAIVLADCDLERTAHGVVWGAFTNAGQNCASIERVYVEKAIAPAFLARVKEIAASLRPGDDVGPLTTADQRDTVEHLVRGAVEAGARVELGGRRPDKPGYWYEPTILADVRDDMEVMNEETFGPVMPVRVVADAEEAIRLANSSRFGLTASVWTRDTERGLAIARRLEAGVVTVNNHSFTGALPAAPWSGVKETGFGATNSHLALMEMVRPRFVLVDRAKSRELWWYPYNDRLRQVATGLRDLALGRYGAVLRLLPALRNRFR